MPDELIEVPPFPPLKWDTYSWTGEITLPSWAGFQSRGGGYGSVSAQGPSTGTVVIRVESPGDSQQPPTPAQWAAVRHLLEHEAGVALAVAQALFEYYPTARAKFLKANGTAAASGVPTIRRTDDLRSLMGLNSVHVLRVVHENIAYLGFEFGCNWEEEHGAGVMTHGDRVVAIGHATVSFDYWTAREDAERGG